MSMMQKIGTVTREAFGFHGDSYPGFFLLKGGEPVLQLHLYDHYYTLFWRGLVDLYVLEESLLSSVDELGRFLGIPAKRLNTVSAQYTCQGRPEELTFTLRPLDPEEGDATRRHQEFVRKYSRSISFARYDVSHSRPIILWADLDGAEEPEIGFSSFKVLPPAVLQLFSKTCFTQVSEEELYNIGQTVRGLISRKGQNYNLA
jgi:hypothetical protein